MNSKKRLRNLKQEFFQLASYFDKDIWFVKQTNSQLKYFHSDIADIENLYYYFDLKDVGIFDLKEYYVVAALFVKGKFEVAHIFVYVFGLLSFFVYLVLK